jgi:hypothetical protein
MPNKPKRYIGSKKIHSKAIFDETYNNSHSMVGREKILSPKRLGWKNGTGFCQKTLKSNFFIHMASLKG